MDMKYLTPGERFVLETARNTYGDTAQILVANEELCELAAVCAKYPRYSDKTLARKELHNKAVDEVADVLIVLDHIVHIFGLDEQELNSRITGKVSRLYRWLSASSSMQRTTEDRDVEEF